MSIKLGGMRLWNNLPTSLVKRKLNLGKKCFVKAAKTLLEFTTTVVLKHSI